MGSKDLDYYSKYISYKYTCRCDYCSGNFNYLHTYTHLNNPNYSSSLKEGQIYLIKDKKIVIPGCQNHNHKGTGMNCKRCRGGAKYKNGL